MKSVKIENKEIGLGKPTLIIAEVGVNHNGSLKRGFDLIDAAKLAGADIVKFQTYKAKQIVTKNAPRYWNDNLNDDFGGNGDDFFFFFNFFFFTSSEKSCGGPSLMNF